MFFKNEDYRQSSSNRDNCILKSKTNLESERNKCLTMMIDTEEISPETSPNEDFDKINVNDNDKSTPLVDEDSLSSSFNVSTKCYDSKKLKNDEELEIISDSDIDNDEDMLNQEVKLKEENLIEEHKGKFIKKSTNKIFVNERFGCRNPSPPPNHKISKTHFEAQTFDTISSSDDNDADDNDKEDSVLENKRQKFSKIDLFQTLSSSYESYSNSKISKISRQESYKSKSRSNQKENKRSTYKMDNYHEKSGSKSPIQTLSSSSKLRSSTEVSSSKEYRMCLHSKDYYSSSNRFTSAGRDRRSRSRSRSPINTYSKLSRHHQRSSNSLHSEHGMRSYTPPQLSPNSNKSSSRRRSPQIQIIKSSRSLHSYSHHHHSSSYRSPSPSYRTEKNSAKTSKFDRCQERLDRSRSRSPLQSRSSSTRNEQRATSQSTSSQTRYRDRNHRDRDHYRDHHRSDYRRDYSPYSSSGRYYRSPSSKDSRSKSRSPLSYGSTLLSSHSKRSRSDRHSRSPINYKECKSSSILLNESKFPSNSLAAELANKIKMRKLHQPRATSTPNLNEHPNTSDSSLSNNNSLTPALPTTPDQTQPQTTEQKIANIQNGNFTATIKNQCAGSSSVVSQVSQSQRASQPQPSTLLQTHLSQLPMPPISSDIGSRSVLSSKIAITQNNVEQGGTKIPKYSSSTTITLNINGQMKTMPRPRIIGKTIVTTSTRNRDIKPRSVDVFQIVSQIGEGTYGQVYKAKDTDKWYDLFIFVIGIIFILII